MMNLIFCSSSQRLSNTGLRTVLMLAASTFWLAMQPDGAEAHGVAPPSLKGVPLPRTPGLVDGRNPIVVNPKSAIQLGKALFWDTAVGSDGVACATCHFHAGADRRIRNQLTTGTFHQNAPTATTFEATASGRKGGPNYTLRRDDFPFYQLADPNDKQSAVVYATDDVVSSSGVALGLFQGVHPAGKRNDECEPAEDDIFHQGNLNTRRVEPRNTPTVINAAFNFRNFWDGRANNLFNGESPFGPRDPKAGVWVTQKNGTVLKTRIRLENASLASQATAPALSDTEMSCVGRTFPELGRKLLQRRPLAAQNVHPNDSVLGEVRHASGKGLNGTYAALIRESFAPRYWSGTGDFGTPAGGSAPYTHLEANFAFFFGLALQLYQETLISDDTPFDTPRDEDGVPMGLDAQQARGLQVFLDAHCALCHKGPTLSSAAHPSVYSVADPAGLLLVNRKTLNGSFTGQGIAFGLLDEGFTNTSVTPTDDDPGLGGKDPFGNPLSYTEQYLRSLLGEPNAMVDPIKVKSCMLEVPFAMDYSRAELIDDPYGKQGCGSRKIYAKTPKPEVLRAELDKPGQGGALAAVHGAFKVPSLRNVELTGPYMHNGGMKSLEEVVDFYNRGGNLDNPHHFATLVFPQGLSEANKKDLVAFLKSLTDPRVRWERAPFDHPQLRIPHGHTRNVSPQYPDRAEDRYFSVPAVGKEGRSVSQGPLRDFESYLGK
jgi:cytochrome c peroxidase